MYIKISITGRPNVGKSTLFNKLARKNSSIVYDIPGITRDIIDASCELYKLKLKISDTAGFDNTKYDEISLDMIRQSTYAMQDSDIIFFMIDGREGLNYLDFAFAENLRKFNKPVILVCNKCENPPTSDKMNEIYSLGFKNIVFMSAEHKQGFVELAYKIKEVYYDSYGINLDDAQLLDEESKVYQDKLKKLSIAIVGRPNSGKSTMFNKILGEYRAIVSPLAGTTRDAIHKEIAYKDCTIDMVDTAGIRKRLNIDDKIESLSVQSAFYSIKFATTVILCIDAQRGFESQDFSIAKFTIEEGRAVAIVVNKWDLVQEKDRKKMLDQLDEFINTAFPRIKGVPFFTISAQNDENLHDILDECILLHEIWSKRINTAKLNAFIREIADVYKPPKHKGHDVKVKFVTQVNTRPMTLCVFTNILEGISTEYQHLLENEIRDKFGIFGVPIRMIVKKSHNPFEYKTKSVMYKKDDQISDRFKKVVKQNTKIVKKNIKKIPKK